MATNNINFRSVKEVATAESLTDGDKVLLNSGGVAKQIDASKIGGGTMYAELIFDQETGENNFVRIYEDEAHTQMLTYDQAKEKFKSGVVLYGTAFDVTAVVTPLTVAYNEGTKTFTMAAFFESIMPFAVLCADSIT